jgi:allantoicase
MKTPLEKLKAKLSKVEAALEKNRTTALNDGWQTQRHARKSRNWDALAREKISLIQKIEELEAS